MDYPKLPTLKNKKITKAWLLINLRHLFLVGMLCMGIHYVPIVAHHSLSILPNIDPQSLVLSNRP